MLGINDESLSFSYLLTLEEAASYLDVHEYTILGLLVHQEFPLPIKVELEDETIVGFSEADLMDWEVQQMQKA